MRIVALLVALAGILAVMPAQADAPAAGGIPDDCISQPVQGILCQKIEPPVVGSPAPTTKTHYLWIGPGKCASPGSSACRGTPAGEGSTLGLFGLLYVESNDAAGLQRAQARFGDQLILPDRMLLV